MSNRRIANWPTAKLIEVGSDIIDFFYTDPAGDGGRAFGCDWPTMWALHPLKCALFRRVKSEYKRRQLPVIGGAI